MVFWVVAITGTGTGTSAWSLVPAPATVGAPTILARAVFSLEVVFQQDCDGILGG